MALLKSKRVFDFVDENPSQALIMRRALVMVGIVVNVIIVAAVWPIPIINRLVAIRRRGRRIIGTLIGIIFSVVAFNAVFTGI